MDTGKVSAESNGKTAGQAELLYNRLVKRYRHLRKWARRTGTGAYRLYDRDIPEIPLVLDLYGDAVSGAVYKSRRLEDEETPETWLPAMKASIARALAIPESRIFLKERRRMRRRQETGIQYNKLSAENFYRDVNEGDLIFRVNLSDYLDTGLFLDARKKRALLGKEAAGKRVLNLFAYTCSLSIAAAKGGASHVDSVDLSNTYLEWGKLNFALNGLSAVYAESGARSTPSAYTLIRGDVIRFLGEAARQRRQWDIIILDPPGFSNSKKMTGSLDLRRDYRELIGNCLSLLSPGGSLWFSSGAKGLRLESGDFPGCVITDIGKDLADEDFRERRTPRCYILLREQ